MMIGINLPSLAEFHHSSQRIRASRRTTKLSITAFSKLVFYVLSMTSIAVPITGFSQDAGQQRQLRLSNSTAPPLTNKAGNGYLDQLIDEIEMRTGLEIMLTVPPAARSLELVNKGFLDGDIARTAHIDKPFENIRKVAEPMFEIALAGLYLDTDIHVNKPEDFDQYRVGYVRGWTVAESVLAGSSKLTPTRNVDLLMDMLKAGRIDIAFMTVVPGRFIGNKKDIENLHITEFRIIADHHMYLHKSNEDLLSLLNNTLKTMKKDGSYDSIMTCYYNLLREEKQAN